MARWTQAIRWPWPHSRLGKNAHQKTKPKGIQGIMWYNRLKLNYRKVFQEMVKILYKYYHFCEFKKRDPGHGDVIIY